MKKVILRTKCNNINLNLNLPYINVGNKKQILLNKSNQKKKKNIKNKKKKWII